MGINNDPALAWMAMLVAPSEPKQYLLDQARKLLAQSGQVSPPFCPKKALPGTIVRLEMAKLSRDGMLIPIEGGFVLKLNSSRPRVRQSFACAHEIGHTFFYDTSGTKPWRPHQSLSSYWAEESLCYQFAEEMLMPTEQMLEIGAVPRPSIVAFQRLLRTFRVSAESLARRIARLNLWQCIIVVVSGEAGNSASLKRRVTYKHHTHKNCAIDLEKLASQAGGPLVAMLDPGVPKYSTSIAGALFRKGGKRQQWCVESLGLPSATSKIAISIILPWDVSAELSI